MLGFCLSLLNYSATYASNSIEINDENSPDSIDYFSRSFVADHLATATTTIVINLPIIEQNEPEITPVPDTSDQIDTPTPTPTPIPVQTGTTNLPIVIGAAAIIVVILLAWLFIRYIPSKKQA
jgi:hypothetical protein